MKSFSKFLFRRGERLLLRGGEIEAVNSAAMGTLMSLRAAVSKDDLELLTTARAFDRLSNRKVPFHTDSESISAARPALSPRL